MNFVSNPTITDVLQISTNMNDLHTLSMMIATALLGFVIPLEILRQNMKAMEGQNSYGTTFGRVVLVCVGLIVYKTVFNFLIGAGFVVENAVLSLPKWAEFLDELGKFYMSYKPSLYSSLVPLLFAWLASFLALVIKAVLYWVRYSLLSLLYFVGPISIVLYIFEPSRHMLASWCKNVVQISLWTVVLKILVRIMLELQVKTFLAQANLDSDIITIIGINVTFVVMLVCSPLFTAQFISDHTLGPVAVMAASFFASPAAILSKTNPITLSAGAGKAIASGYRRFVGSGVGAANDVRPQRPGGSRRNRSTRND